MCAHIIVMHILAHIESRLWWIDVIFYGLQKFYFMQTVHQPRNEICMRGLFWMKMMLILGIVIHDKL